MPRTRIAAETRQKARTLRHRMTRAEIALWKELRDLKAAGLHFRRQVPVGPYIVDFACLRSKLLVEVDGDTHETPTGQRHDAVRDAYLASLSYRVVRIYEPDIRVNAWQVAQEIAERCRSIASDPTRPAADAPVHPPLEGEGVAPSQNGEPQP